MIWLFRERMAKSGRDKMVWAELQRQLDAMGLQVKRGTIQDATFIESDPGSSNKTKDGVPRLATVEMGHGQRKARKAISVICFIKKSDIDYCLIREIETTTAKVHDSQIDLSEKSEVVIRDRGYFGAPAKVDDFTMMRRTTDAPLAELDKERNRLISKLRSPGERPHAASIIERDSKNIRTFYESPKSGTMRLKSSRLTYSIQPSRDII